MFHNICANDFDRYYVNVFILKLNSCLNSTLWYVIKHSKVGIIARHTWLKTFFVENSKRKKIKNSKKFFLNICPVRRVTRIRKTTFVYRSKVSPWNAKKLYRMWRKKNYQIIENSIFCTALYHAVKVRNFHNFFLFY